MTGKPNDSASRRASRAEIKGVAVPGTTGTPAASILRRAPVFSPMARMVAGAGPTKTSPAPATASAKSARSARNP